jgi:hypothetical protein
MRLIAPTLPGLIIYILRGARSGPNTPTQSFLIISADQDTSATTEREHQKMQRTTNGLC